MPFTSDEFRRARPFLFHLTARVNLDRIIRLMQIDCAATMYEDAEAPSPCDRRRSATILNVDSEQVHIRDQAPLHRGNIRLEGGWSFARLLQELNRRVFFWPGTSVGPIAYGVRHFERYANERPVILRVPCADILAGNAKNLPFFCKYNSGSPRCTNGVGSPRGPATFVKCNKATFRPSQVVEVTFQRQVALPHSVEISDSPYGGWSLVK